MTSFLIAALLAVPTSQNVTLDDLTSRERAAVERVCKNVDSDNKERCISRQITNLRRTQTNRSTPINANDVRSEMGIGKTDFRNRIRQIRLQEALARAASRRTFRQDPAGDTDLLPDYVTDVRKERLRCMLLPPGRQRSMCLDKMGNKARDQMQETLRTRGTTTTVQ
ncbi:MAG TPA: hypothetical protein VI913_04525 [Candidatus Peribacteraceae bacterium]|nr:hypothetical protein [Candidatus Peribacteraceae bacterium]